MILDLKGTKEAIFDAAVELFSQRGFEVVNMREVAAACKIKAASIYNHYISKQQILDLAYEYFTQHFWDSKRTDAELKELIETGSREEILDKIIISFEGGDHKKYYRMVLICKIIYMRIFDDESAKAIFQKTLNEQPANYVKELLDYGINIGRFRPFDTETYANLLIGCRHSMALKAFATPDYQVAQLEEDRQLTEMLKDLLPIV